MTKSPIDIIASSDMLASGWFTLTGSKVKASKINITDRIRTEIKANQAIPFP